MCLQLAQEAHGVAGLVHTAVQSWQMLFSAKMYEFVMFHGNANVGYLKDNEIILLPRIWHPACTDQ